MVDAAADAPGVVDPPGTEALASIAELRGGALFACARLADGRVACWGRNDSGELGTGLAVPTGCTPQGCARPVRVANLEDAVAITTGGSHACALRRGGTVRCWGAGNRGQLGVTRVPDRCTTRSKLDHRCARAPVDVGGLADVVALSARGNTTCALSKRGAVSCWGEGEGLVPAPRGACAATPTLRVACVPTPARVPGIADAVEIAVGGSTTCARLRSGRVACWGWSPVGELGNGVLARTRADRPVVVAGLTDAVQLVARDRAFCARRSSGEVHCWGEVRNGELGDGRRGEPVPGGGTARARARPGPVLDTAGEPLIATHVWDAGMATCAATTDRGIWCWGAPPRTRRPLPELIPDPCPGSSDPRKCVTTAVRVDAAPIREVHYPLDTCVLLETGHARCTPSHALLDAL